MSWLIDWIRDALSEWVTYLFGGRTAQLVIVGIENAGKTTLLHMLAHGNAKQFPPTTHPNNESLAIGALQFRAWDLGGSNTQRVLWKNYVTAADAIIFVVDAADPDTFASARAELDQLLSGGGGGGGGGGGDDSLPTNIPVAVLGNKIDQTRAVSEEHLREALGLQLERCFTGPRTHDDQPRALQLFMCSLVRRAGYQEAFLWLSKQVE